MLTHKQRRQRRLDMAVAVARGASAAEVAEQYGVTETTVRNAVKDNPSILTCKVEPEAAAVPPSPPMKPLISQGRVAEWLRICGKSVSNLVKSKRLAHVKIGRSVRFRPEDVEAFIERSKVRQAPNNKGAA